MFGVSAVMVDKIYVDLIGTIKFNCLNMNQRMVNTDHLWNMEVSSTQVGIN